MAKRESTLKNMLVSLLVITVVTGGILGFVYSITKDAIAESKAKKNQEAINTVLPLNCEVTNDTITIMYKDSEDDDAEEIPYFFNVAYNSNNEFQGTAIKATADGFGGIIEIMLGITSDDTIRGVSILSHSETPGLGANMTGDFKEQFKDKMPGGNFILEVTKSNEQNKVDAITAATISSKALTKAVRLAYKCYEENKALFVKQTTEVSTSSAADASTDSPNELEITEGGTDNE